MIAIVLQILTLFSGQFQGSSERHDILPSEDAPAEAVPFSTWKDRRHAKRYDELLTRGIAEVLVEKDLRDKLASGRKLRLKQGFDPSRPHMTIGNAVGLRKLRKFQDLGHEVVLIVGDWTAQIGDPSGRDETRPRLTREVVREVVEPAAQRK